MHRWGAPGEAIILDKEFYGLRCLDCSVFYDQCPSYTVEPLWWDGTKWVMEEPRCLVDEWNDWLTTAASLVGER